MLEKVWGNYKKNSKKDNDKVDKFNKTKFCDAWSQEDIKEESLELPERYRLFQELIRNMPALKTNNLEYDYQNWGTNS